MSEIVPGRVSIVIPCYGGAAFVAEAIESCLRQTHADVEVIVVDDASPDDCAAIAQRYVERDSRVHLVRKASNGGVSRAFNSGFRIATGEYYTRLAQDDRLDDDAVRIMKNYLDAHPQAGLVYCDMQVMDTAGNIIEWRRTAEPDRVLNEGETAGLCFMWRQAVWEAIGPFDPRFDAGDDREFLLRLGRHFPIGKVNGIAPFFYRLHPQCGSALFPARQELALKRAYATHCGSRLLASKYLSEGHFGAAYVYRRRGQHAVALRHLIRAILQWPVHLQNYRCLAGLVRDVYSA